MSNPKNGCITANMDAGFFCDYVRQQFLTHEAFGKTDKERAERWRRGGMTIKTTLSPKAQAAAAKAASEKVYKDDEVAASVVSVEPGTGRIQSMAQSRPYGTDPNKHETVLNLAVDNTKGGTSLGFQVGSTFKPIIAAAALEKGIDPADTYRSPWKTEFDNADFKNCDGSSYGTGKYSVQNERKDMKGTWDMTSALGKSVNTYSIDLLRKTGLCETTEMATKMGVRSGTGKQLEPKPAMGLGGLESTPLFMANAYATFANRGTHCTPIAIEGVTDAGGNELRPPKTECTRAMTEKTADSVNQMLKGVVEDGTGATVGLSGRDNAGKTGTTERRRDAWFVGYTPNLSTAVWVGSDGAKRVEMFNITIGGQNYGSVSGSGLPGPIWRTAMTGALDGVDAAKFNPIKVPRGDKKDDKDKGRDEDDDDGDDDDDKNDNKPTPLPRPSVSLPPGLIGGGNGGRPGGGDSGGGDGGRGNGGAWTGGSTGGEPGLPAPR